MLKYITTADGPAPGTLLRNPATAHNARRRRTSIRSVLQQSGLRDRYFGESFADLDSLLAAVYSRLIDEEIAGCAAAIDKTNGGSQGARAMIDTITRSSEKNPGQARIKSREVVDVVTLLFDAAAHHISST